jgi:hypothetical protein
MFTMLSVLIFFMGIVMGSNIETTEDIDFRLALDFAFTSNIDTIFLTTSGGNYFYSTPVSGDTIPLQIYEPIVIMAKPGLAEKPIFRYSGSDSSVIDIFRIQNDVTFEGIIFDGYNAVRPMKYVLRVTHSEDDWTPRRFTKDGLNITIRDCIFRNIYPPGWENNPGAAALYFNQPPLQTDDPVKAGKVIIENCIFRNIGDEALRFSDTEKYVVDRVLDTLIVRNCTFKNISAECIRFYADLDTSTQDAYVLIEHLTVDSSATRMAYIKNNQFTQFRDVMVTNSVLPKPSRLDRYDYIAEVQQRGSLISHVNSWNILINPISTKDKWSAVKNGAEVDTTTVYEFDPLYADPDNFDYSLAPTSPAYFKAYSGNALGDLRWADPSITSIEKPDFLKPSRFTLEQNYPNPFNPATSIQFSLSKLAVVKLKVYDITGAHIATLVNAPRGAGEHVANWRPQLQASGIYFYNLDVDGKVSETKKMILLK